MRINHRSRDPLSAAVVANLQASFRERGSATRLGMLVRRLLITAAALYQRIAAIEKRLRTAEANERAMLRLREAAKIRENAEAPLLRVMQDLGCSEPPLEEPARVEFYGSMVVCLCCGLPPSSHLGPCAAPTRPPVSP